MAVQNWPDTGNWDGGSQYASDPANELRFFANTTTELPAVGTQTITNVPATLSMNTLTLNGKGKNTTPGSFIIVGNNSSTWTIGNGATSLGAVHKQSLHFVWSDCIIPLRMEVGSQDTQALKIHI